ncbi:MAG: FtsW/RodA/SpoVE family cell cycle protein, partial [Chthoniobacteraceae bacterium]
MQRKSVYLLIVAVAILIVIGCVMLFSTSPFAVQKVFDPTKFIRLQVVWLGVGAVVCLIAANINYDIWRRAWPVLFIISLVLLALCFVPGIGKKTNGSSRWLNLRAATFQPSELAKLATIAALAAWYARKDVDAQTFLRGFVAPMALSALPLALIAPEVDIGTTALIGATMLTIMFVAGARLYFLTPMLV